ncbi:MAG: diaminopimelate epimerase [Devosiaceae bacterium]|nr:diaminopimelate epimerase [Devosiaceae bacterium MH13]
MSPLIGHTARVMNGAGNRITVLDLNDTDHTVTGDEARAIASFPQTSFDQLMVIHAPRVEGTAATIAIFNTDGSSAEACGNGTRCVGWHLEETQGIEQSRMVETAAGLLRIDREAAPLTYTVDMGTPKFGWQDIPLSEPFQDTRFIELHVGPADNPVLSSPAVASMGNPHAVFWVDDVNAIALDKIGPVLEYHPLFPERANISIAQVMDRQTLVMRTWERGAGLTLACGSAACAAAVCAARLRRTERTVTIHQPGGTLQIRWDDSDHVWMTGPVEHERDVELTDTIIAGLAA